MRNTDLSLETKVGSRWWQHPPYISYQNHTRRTEVAYFIATETPRFTHNEVQLNIEVSWKFPIKSSGTAINTAQSTSKPYP